MPGCEPTEREDKVQQETCSAAWAPSLPQGLDNLAARCEAYYKQGGWETVVRWARWVGRVEGVGRVVP